MKKGILMMCVWIMCTLGVQARQHPCMYASPGDKADIQQKIKNEAWAKEAFAKVRAHIEKYADRHVVEPEWIVSRLAMYWKDGERYTQCYLKKQNWDRGEGNAPVPTVRMPGMRTWNKYVNVSLEDRTPYNETGDMWGVNKHNPSEPPVKVPYKESGHLIRGNNVEILNLAGEAAFVYWVTGEEKFARFAADIFNTWLVGTYYMNPILDPEKSCGSAGGWEPGGICGYYDYEQIHDDLAMNAAIIYDFAFDYLVLNPHAHLKETGKSTKTVASEVFKRFIDIGMIRGQKKGNWNVNGWNVILRPILVLDDNDAYADGKGREYYLNFLVNESTSHHDAIPDILKTYDPVTGLWPESPGYAFSTVSMLLDWAGPLRRAGVDIIANNPILQKAALAVFPWMDNATNFVVFGDSRGGAANFQTFENLLAYYAGTNNKENMQKVAGALNRGIASGKYVRGKTDWTGICTYAATIPSVQGMADERASYSPHHRFIAMKNWNAPYKMMANLYGGKKGFHLSSNGLALQLYAYGYALAPDAAAYESYWSKDHGYHQSPTGSNTILPGYAEGEITINAMEPVVKEDEFVNEKELTPYVNFADVSAGEKRRVVAVVRTSDNSGYYVDIFRSDLEDNDYLFHNVGSSLYVTDTKGGAIATVSLEKFDKSYHKQYDWFTNLRKSDYAQDFIASWTMPELITARLWMTGMKGREIYQVDALATTLIKGLTPGNTSMPPASTPTLIVRQLGNNAKVNPFIGVYEAYKGDAPDVLQVSALKNEGGFAGVKVKTTEAGEDYVFSATDMQRYHPVKHVSFCGNFGMIREKAGEMQFMYLGNGRSLKNETCSLEADKNVYASVYKKEGEWRYSATGTVKITIGNKVKTLNEGYDRKF